MLVESIEEETKQGGKDGQGGKPYSKWTLSDMDAAMPVRLPGRAAPSPAPAALVLVRLRRTARPACLPPSSAIVWQARLVVYVYACACHVTMHARVT